MGTSRSIERLIRRIFGGFIAFTFAFMFAFLFSAQFTPVSDGSAAEISVMNQVTGYYANLSSLGTLSLTLASSPEGTYATTKDTITVDTNTTTGYKLYISTIDHSSDTPSLPDSTPSNGLIDSASGSYLSPSTGAADTPVRLAVNTWGYAPSRATSSETPTVYTDSDAAPTEDKGGKAVWRAVPEYGNEDIFYTNSSPATASTNSVDVYYAVNASTALPSGTYSNTVVYTAIVDGGTDETGDTEASISPVSQDGLDSGQEVTIATSLYPGLSLNNLGDITVKIGDNDCTDITPVLTEINSLNITCKVPAQTTSGDYSVTVTIAKYGTTYNLSYSYRTYATVLAGCQATNVGGSFYLDDNTGFIKLKDGNCWTKSPVATNLTWDEANALNAAGASAICPTGSHVPSAQEYVTLTGYYDGVANTANYGVPYGFRADTGALYDATGWPYALTSSTEYAVYSSTNVWGFGVDSTSITLGGGTLKTAKRNVICVGSTVPEFYAITDMQQMNHEICASVPAPTSENMTTVITKSNWTSASAGTPETTLVDTRSGTAKTTCTVRKFADGKCWMARNLRYAPSAATTLSSGSSDVLSTNTWQMPKLGTYNSGRTDYDGDEVVDGQMDNGVTYDATYYSWHAATAGTGVSSMASGNTTQSVCPKNWRLPTGGDGVGTTAATAVGSTLNLVNGDYKMLDIAFGGTGEQDNNSGGYANWVNTIYGFGAALLGAFNGSTVFHGGTVGAWWSSSVSPSGATRTSNMGIDSVSLPQSNGYSGYSFALRCVAR